MLQGLMGTEVAGREGDALNPPVPTSSISGMLLLLFGEPRGSMLLGMLFQSCGQCWGSCSPAAVVLGELHLHHHLLLFSGGVLQGNVQEVFLGPWPTPAGTQIQSAREHQSLYTLPNLHPYYHCQILQVKQQGTRRF